jgi:hypothetical protein
MNKTQIAMLTLAIIALYSYSKGRKNFDAEGILSTYAPAAVAVYLFM